MYILKTEQKSPLPKIKKKKKNPLPECGPWPSEPIFLLSGPPQTPLGTLIL